MVDMKKSLDTLSGLLKTLVGETPVVSMTKQEFLVHVQAEVTKANTLPEAEKAVALKNIGTLINLVKDNYVDTTADSFKVPLTIMDTTALRERQNLLIDAVANMSSGAGNQTAFASGFVNKEALEKCLAIFKEFTDAAKAQEPAAATAPAAVAVATTKEASDIAEDDDAVKAVKVVDVVGAVAKGLDVSADGTVWPKDLNSAEFKTNQVVKSLGEWGRDGEKV